MGLVAIVGHLVMIQEQVTKRLVKIPQKFVVYLIFSPKVNINVMPNTYVSLVNFSGHHY